MRLLVHNPHKKGFLSTLSVRRATDSIIGVERDFQFLSTLSVRRATDFHAHAVQIGAISIHALREESDNFRAFVALKLADFYPRSP